MTVLQIHPQSGTMNNATQAATAPQRIRIMVVEDEADIGLIISQLLSSHYDVLHAANGLEALERLAWYQPDLAIMDLMMPVLDGFDTTRAIKKDNDYSNMPVMFLTARKDNQSVREALMAGGDIYLEKPFDPPELMTRLQEMIARNNLTPRPKRYTLAQIRQHFAGPAQATEAEPTLPLGPRPLTEQLAMAAAEPRARILLISDSDSTVRAAKTHLRRQFEVIASSDPETSMDKIIAYQPDIIIISVQMAAFNGFHLAQLLRVNRQLRVPHVVFLSAEDDQAIQVQAAKLGGTLVPMRSLNMDKLALELNSIVSAPGYRRQRKRIDYREILRREEPTSDE